MWVGVLLRACSSGKSSSLTQAGMSWHKLLLSQGPGMSQGSCVLFWPWHGWRSSPKPEQETQPCISLSCWMALTQAGIPVWFPAAPAMLVGKGLEGQNKP